jgi:FlaA1/EpsC-like NDP-sugar epimerase
MGSRGSVIPFFLERRKTGRLPITDPAMTRFNITINDGVRMVLWALSEMRGGEIFVPKIPSYRIVDVAEAIAPGLPHDIVGIRPGEKLHEEMITATDSHNTLDLGRYFAILPSTNETGIVEQYRDNGARQVPRGFSYNSGENTDFLTIDALRAMIRRELGIDLG